MRQSSSASTDSDEISAAQCPLHGSGVNIDLIKDNIGAQPAPMLKALCNDPSLRSRCTCVHPVELTPSYNTPRRLSLSQPVQAYDQPGVVSRPYSWASEYGGGSQLLNLPAIDVDSLSGPSAVELVNGGVASRAVVHRHSDGAVGQTTYRMHADGIMANH